MTAQSSCTHLAHKAAGIRAGRLQQHIRRLQIAVYEARVMQVLHTCTQPHIDQMSCCIFDSGFYLKISLNRKLFQPLVGRTRGDIQQTSVDGREIMRRKAAAPQRI